MRETKTVIIPAVGLGRDRDKGKTFLLTEMSATRAEKWADRAFLALGRSRVDLPPGIERTRRPDFHTMALLVGNMKFPDLEPLMDELMSCVQIIPDPRNPGFVRAPVEEDIEEVATRQYLRSEVLDLHVNFMLAATILNWIAVASTMTTLHGSETTSTSRRRSAS